MWYPPVEPYDSGLLAVAGGHEVYWETCGNPRGVAALVLHGGPGGGCSPNSRRWFDPRRYRIVLFDQRGCGRSRPHGSLDQNTTADLIADIECLRATLDVDRWLLFGRSWGAALALAYAEQHLQRVAAAVLCGVLTARQSELDWLYQGGAGHMFPEAWACFIAPIPEGERSNLVAAYHARLTCGVPDAEIEAARHWCRWEQSIGTLLPASVASDDRAMHARARIESHYFKHRAFLEAGQLLAHAHRLRDIPGVIIQGRYDVITPPVTARDLHHAWPGSTLTIVPDAGHAATEPGTMRALVDATDRLAAHLTASAS